MDELASTDPRTIGGYRLLGKLGEGGMGRVYLARSERGRTVAVKVVQAELARQRDFRRRFTQEVNAARRVGGEWTAPVLDADTEAETPWVATGYVAGPSLESVVDRDFGPLPDHSVRALAAGLLRALDAIHGAGLVHRDLKPSNILLTIDGPRVIDFGIARALDTVADSGLTRTGSVIGSPGFMSPEQVRGLRVTPASDVFSLGVVLAYVATGRMPFGTIDSGIHAVLFRIAEEEPDLTGLDGWLREIVSGCLAKAPEARPTVRWLLERMGDDVSYSGAWLPGEVLAQLGRHAVQLLDSEDPTTTGTVSYQSADALPTTSADTPQATPGAAANPPGAPTPTVSPRATAPASPPGFGAPVSPYPPTGVPTGPYPWQPGTPPGGLGPRPVPGRPVTSWGGGGVPPPAAPRPLAQVRRLALTTCVLFGALVLLSLFEFVRHLALGDLLRGLEEDFSLRTVEDLEVHKDVSQVVAVVSALLHVVIAALWLVWFWLTRENAEKIGPGRVRYPSGLAVGAWFIPFANLVLPKQIADDICVVSNRQAVPPAFPGHRPRTFLGLLHAWWAAWLLHMVLNLVAWLDIPWYELLEDGHLPAARDAANYMVLDHLVTVPAAILALLVVLRITKYQDQRAGRRP